ncbi:hypothetical protein Syun_020498 [Stephania yunnanensis]|uniref:Transmembrane protein n=1 Tax=Stephania yunnanensis TaxID=152371 RepID=A0AAP0IF80_9MAGN
MASTGKSQKGNRGLLINGSNYVYVFIVYSSNVCLFLVVVTSESVMHIYTWFAVQSLGYVSVLEKNKDVISSSADDENVKKF